VPPTNSTYKDFIAESIIRRQPQVVGVYRRIMRTGSDNVYVGAMQGVVKRTKANGIKVVYEPVLKENALFGSAVIL